MIDPKELILRGEEVACFSPEASAEESISEDLTQLRKSPDVELGALLPVPEKSRSDQDREREASLDRDGIPAPPMSAADEVPSNTETPSGENSTFRCDRRGLIKDGILAALGIWALGERVWGAEWHQPSTPISPEPVTMIVPVRSAGAEAIAFAREQTFGLPVTGVAIPALRVSSLPNALRLYRRGIHQGFDLYCAYGTDVRAISDGIVTRADGVAELSPELHRHLLSMCAALNTTPPDILRRLTGRCVELDHGTREGTRVRSVYGHLSFLCVSEGELVRRGDSLGAVGNSGTTAGVRRSREESHLHLEIWIHRVGSPEVYLGEGMEEQDLRQLLQEIFSYG